MSTSIREYLLDELGVDESKNLSNVSKYIRANTKLNDSDKCECCICKVKSKQMNPKEKTAQTIYNHHVMKVEYLAILADRYHMCYTTKEDKKKLIPADYTYYPGFKPYSPRVAVCDLHHTMFHELVGDNDLDKIRRVTLSDAENFVEVFEEFNDDIRSSCKVKDTDFEDKKGYKKTYQGIWDETLIKSLTRLSYILKINELKLDEKDMEENYDKYEALLNKIDNILAETMEFDDKGDVKLPDVDIFSLNDLMLLENELEGFEFKKEFDETSFEFTPKKNNKQNKNISNDVIKVEEPKEEIIEETIEERPLRTKEELYKLIDILSETANEISVDEESTLDELYEEISELYDDLLKVNDVYEDEFEA